MVSGPSAVGSTPIINFRPDPGEPAVRLSAREPQTAGLVAGQELRNETRLRLRAIARGDDVLFTNRTFTLGLGQTSPVFQAGLTSVVTRSDPNGAAPNQRFAPTPAGGNQEAQQSEEGRQTGEAEETEEDNPLEPKSLLEGEATEKTEEELEQEERDLESEDSRLERNLAQARLQQERALELGNLNQLQRAQREEEELEREQDELDKELQQVELDRLEKQLEETLGATNQAITDNLEAAIGPLDVLFGLQVGQGNQKDREPAFQPTTPITPEPFDNTFFARKR